MSNIDIYEISRVSSRFKLMDRNTKTPKIKSAISEKKVDNLLYNSETLFYIPEFQREYTWGVNEITALVDSMLKGIYCSGFTIWKTNDYITYNSEKHKNFQDYFNDNIKKIAYSNLHCLYNTQYKKQFELEIEKIYNRESSSKNISCIIDGQQRITTLFFLKDGVCINDKLDYTKFYINIPNFIKYIENKSDLHQQIPLCEYIKNDLENSYNYISVHNILNQEFSIGEYLDKIKEQFELNCDNSENYLETFYEFKSNYTDIFSNLKNRMFNFSFTYSEVSNVEYNEILEFFIRQNVAGKKLTNLDITLSCLFSYDLDVQKKLDDIWNNKSNNSKYLLDFFKGTNYKYKQKSTEIILTSFNLYLTKGLKPELNVKNVPENLNKFLKNNSKYFNADEVFNDFMRTITNFINILNNDFKVSTISILPTESFFKYIYAIYLNSNLSNLEFIDISQKIKKIFIKLGLTGSDNSRASIFESRLYELIKIINDGVDVVDINNKLDIYYEEKIFIINNDLKNELMSPTSNMNNKLNNSKIKAYWWFYLLQNPVCCGTGISNRTDTQQDHIFPNSIYNDSSILNYNLIQEYENKSKGNKQPNYWFTEKEKAYAESNNGCSYYDDVVKSNIISKEMYDILTNKSRELTQDDLEEFKDKRFNLFIDLLNKM